MPIPLPDPHLERQRLVRAERPAGDVDPFVFLRRAAGLPRGFWERDGRWCAWAGAAAVLRVESPPEDGGPSSPAVRPAVRVRERASDVLARVEPASGEAGGTGSGAEGLAAGAARFHGGLAFDPDDRRSAGPGPAGDFPAARFHLPALELRGGEEGGDEARLAAVVRVPADLDPEEAGRTARRALDRVLRRLREAAPEEATGGTGGGLRCSRVDHAPGRGGWEELVEAALAAVREGTLEKVVPARLVELALDRAPDPVLLLARLREDNPGTFPYMVEAGPGTVLLGAAPEIVASRANGRFEATAVAGTVREGEGREERERLAQRLLDSEKDRTEHEVGVEDMREALLSVAGVAEVDAEPTVLRLRGMQHLLTHLSARVPDELHVLSLLDAMHPTAAVNGRPRAAAKRFLRGHEPFRRGWFAGPVGWFDATGDGEFAPALRCVVLDGDRARLFAGAGIVEGSRPEAEWDETSVKLLPVLRALGLDPDAVEVEAARAAPSADADRVARATGG